MHKPVTSGTRQEQAVVPHRSHGAFGLAKLHQRTLKTHRRDLDRVDRVRLCAKRIETGHRLSETEIGRARDSLAGIRRRTDLLLRRIHPRSEIDVAASN